MVFSTNSDLFYIYLQYESEKVHGLFGLGWKNQEHTVCGSRGGARLDSLLSQLSPYILPGSTSQTTDRRPSRCAPTKTVRAAPMWNDTKCQNNFGRGPNQMPSSLCLQANPASLSHGLLIFSGYKGRKLAVKLVRLVVSMVKLNLVCLRNGSLLKYEVSIHKMK